MSKAAMKQRAELIVVRTVAPRCPFCGEVRLRTRSSRRNGLGDRIARVECSTCGRVFRLEEIAK